MKFDYIIIGAGSAGCVLANRLTENAKNNVGIFEAGKSSDIWKSKCLSHCCTQCMIQNIIGNIIQNQNLI